MHLICDLRSTKKGCGGKLWLGGEAASGDLALLEAHQITTVMPASKNPRPVESFGVKVYKYVDGTGLANGDYSLEDFFAVADQKCHVGCDHSHEAVQLGGVSGSELCQRASQHC